MPTLEWIGKEKVVNHHLDVPYRVLERKYSYDADGQHAEDNGSENMIIRGDNLEALKALLPRYEGRVKCIYIDPPYNTGNEGWVYNDNVNDPRIKKWLGQVVGAEGEDLSRHDKWLCMMYPRLKLLKRLLANDGAIFISIDDNELYNLKAICDEVFGSNCFVANISWQRTYSMRNDSKGIPSEIEHVLVYSSIPNWQPKRLPRTDSMNTLYKNIDNDPNGDWRNTTPYAPGASTHQGMVYAIQHPFTGELLYPANGSCWRYQQDQMLEYMCGWCKYELRDLEDKTKRAEICGVSEDAVKDNVMGIVLSEPLEISRASAEKVYKRGAWPRYFFTKNGYGGLGRKTYLENLGGKPATNFWSHEEVGHTDTAKKEILSLFDGLAMFDTPKPTSLLERIVQISSDDDSIILDSFAGSGTTAHAVLNMNRADGGKRKFILVEMMDYADTITAERVKRVIQGYGEGKKAVDGTGGNFSFYDLGPALLLPDGNLNEAVGVDRIREYVWYMETKTPLAKVSSANPYYLGKARDTGYYFYYEKEQITTLNHSFLSTIQERAESYLIYADLCTIPDAELKKYNITFKKIPRDIAKL